jgi:hypothetical protein
MSEWKPIATAPRRCIEFQAWLSNDDGVGFWAHRCRYNEDGAFEFWGRVDYDMDGWDTYPHVTPTHWMEQPSAPGNEE